MRYEKPVAVLLFTLATLAAVFHAGAGSTTAVAAVTPQPAPHPPAFGAAANGQLPPEILLDGHLLRAEEAIRQRDPAPARAAMEQIQALQGEHVLEIPPTYHYRYATVWGGTLRYMSPEVAGQHPFMDGDVDVVVMDRIRRRRITPDAGTESGSERSSAVLAFTASTLSAPRSERPATAGAFTDALRGMQE